MKRSDLFRQYARVIDMCEGTGVDPLACIRLLHVGARIEMLSFMLPSNHYAFAVAILEGKPVFEGDELYHKTTGIKRVMEANASNLSDSFKQQFTWKKPRTFTLNGEVLPCPQPECADNEWWFTVSSRAFRFDNREKRDQVQRAVLKLLTDAQNS